MKTHKITALATFLDEAEKYKWSSEILAKAIIAKLDSLDQAEVAISPHAQTGPLATVRRITNSVQLGDTAWAIKLLTAHGGHAANEQITALLGQQAEEIKRLRADKARLDWLDRAKVDSLNYDQGNNEEPGSWVIAWEREILARELSIRDAIDAAAKEGAK